MDKGYCVFLLWLIVLYASGAAHFLQGFLLTRREIHLKSSVSDGVSCCMEAKYDKVIILLIDALRYDFLLYDNKTKEEGMSIAHNNMPVVQRLIEDNHGILYQFIADPPTTTMQRLKGITTGSLPTFIDAGSNFASDELLEDNLVHQITSSGLNVTFMGDDTWMGLFPNSFHRSYPFPSFDVWDIHTVDRGVEYHLFSEMSKPDWNLLIAHCLGVDHTGHRYGPEHPAMPLKLKEMNSLVEKIVANMSEESLLLVMGDHGMTRSGDHGGDSPDEVNAGLFAYSHRWNIKLNDSKTKVVSQVDLVPTLALLLGVPIPYSNLGSVIIDFVNPQQISEESYLNDEHKRLVTMQHFSDALHLNTKQVWRYLQTYNEDSTLPKKEFQHLRSRFHHVSNLYDQVKVSDCFNSCSNNSACCPQHRKMEEYIYEARIFLDEAKAMCSSMWANFDLTSIGTGLLIFVTSVCLHMVVLSNFEAISTKSISYFGVSSSLISFVMQRWSVVCAAIVNLIPVILCLVWSLRLIRIKQFELVSLVPYIMAASYTSNSFVVEEPYVVHYLAQSLIWLPFLLRGQAKNRQQWILRAGMSFSTRFGLAFFRCREEQFPSCEAHSLHRTLNSLSGSNWIVYGRISLALLCCLILYRLFLRYIPIDRKIGYLVSIVWCYWILQAICFLLSADSSNLFYIPRLFYFVFILNIFHVIYRFLFDGEVSKPFNYRKKSSELVVLLSTLAILLAGDGLTPGIIATLANILCLARLFSEKNCNTKEMWVLYGVLSVHGFFASGHHTSLPNIPWESAFVGFSHSATPSGWANVLPALLVSYTTAFSLLLHAIAVPVVVLSSPVVGRNESRTRIISLWLYLLFFHGIRLFGCMGAAALHRRHLMVWKIFAPRLLFELLFAAYTSVGIVTSLLLFQTTM